MRYEEACRTELRPAFPVLRSSGDERQRSDNE